MANIPISVTKQYRYAGGWSNEENASLAYVGSYTSGGKTYNNLVIIPIEISVPNAINKILKVTLSFLKHNMASLSVKCTLTNQGKGTGTSIQGTIISENTQNITVNQSTATPATFTLNPGNYEGKLYLWITSNYWCDITADRSASLTYDINYINPTSPAIETKENNVYIPSESTTITINWSGGGNSTNVNIDSYVLKIRRNSASGSELYSKTGISPTKTSQTISWSDFSNEPARGDVLYATIQTIGNISGYNGTENSGQIGRINKLPDAPTYSISGTSVNANNNIVFTINSSNKDSDNQDLTYYYSFTKDNKKYEITSNILTIGINTDGVQSGNNTIVFYAYDGFEFSSASVSHTFVAITKPEINNVNSIEAGFTDMMDNPNLSTAIKISFTMNSGTPSSVKLFVRSENKINLEGADIYQVSEGFNYDQNTRTINIPDVGLIVGAGSKTIKRGEYFQFAFKVSDGGSDSDFSKWTEARRRPYAPRCPSYANYDVHTIANMTVKAGFYKNKVTVNYTNEEKLSGYAKITALEMIASYGNSSQPYACDFTSDVAFIEMNLNQVNENTDTSFAFRITDEMGQTVTSETLFTLTKSSKLTFLSSVVDVNEKNLKPLSNNMDFIIYHPSAFASGVEDDDIAYEYYIKIGNIEKQITNYTLDKTIPEQINVIISADDINQLILNNVPNQNSAFDANITVIAIDGFDDRDSKYTSFKINFTEPPYFLDDSLRFKIRHDYLIDSTEAGPNVGRLISSTGTPRPENRMINSGEGIIFVLPKAADPNNDIKEYQIYLARKDFTGAIENINNMKFNQLLISIPYEVLEKGTDYKDGYYYYRYKASNYTKNEQFYFKVRVVDQTTNTSKDLICEDYIIGCRTVSPSFSAGEIKIEINQNNMAKLDYDFIITDLGGSATTNGWDEDFYDDYPNFDRSFDGYNRKATLLVEIAPNQDFNEGQISSNKNNLIEFTPSEDKLYQFTSDTASIQLNNNVDYTKMFIRFTLTISYGLKTGSELATKSSSQIYTYFGSVPTVAHRSHKVGINTTDLDVNDVFVIEGYQQSKYVKFKGITNGQTYTITFDLSDGSINGAIIDGGSW